jgi:delta 1-pyrroline-5-carboxylate dehydrogenase
MVRKYSALILGGILGVAILASTSWAQPPGGRQGMRGMGPMGGGGPMGLLALLNNEKVQKELELVDDQKTKLTKLGEETRTAMMESFGALRDLSDEERGPKMQQLMKDNQEKTQKKLAEILMPNQLERIKQIQLQAEGAMALFNPDVVKALTVTDEQQKKLNTIRDELQTKMREARQGMQDLSQEERQAKMQKMRDEQNAKLLEVLTQEQRDKFEKMKGEKVDIDFSTLMRGPGMGRGPRGGRGPGGGGPGGGQGN